MAAGVTDRLWRVVDLVALWESHEQRRAERAAKSMTLPILLIELAKLLIGIGALVAAVFVAKMLRNSK